MLYCFRSEWVVELGPDPDVFRLSSFWLTVWTQEKFLNRNLLLQESHGQRSLGATVHRVTESDTTEVTCNFLFWGWSGHSLLKHNTPCQGKSKDISGTGGDPNSSLYTYTQAYSVSQGPTTVFPPDFLTACHFHESSLLYSKSLSTYILILCHLWCCFPATVKNVLSNTIAKLYYSWFVFFRITILPIILKYRSY